MSSTDASAAVYSPEQRRWLLQLAVRSIAHGLTHGRALEVAKDTLEPALREPRATFVTLHEDGELRGCIGMLEAARPLAEDVAANAFAAAFRDPRFEPLQAQELPRLELSVSVLTPPYPIEFRDEADLISQLRPGVDGVILRDGGRRGTFLPSVWEQLPDPTQFLAHLKGKAGLPASYWSPGLRAERYTTESFGAAVPTLGVL